MSCATDLFVGMDVVLGPNFSLRVGVSSLKEVGLSSGFSRCFLLVCYGTGRTLCAGARSFVLNALIIARCWALRGTFNKLAGRSLTVFSSSPVAVVLVIATAPQVIPSCIRSPYGKRSGRLASDRLAQYCSLRPSCETELVPITVTSFWDRSRRIHDTPRTEQGSQGS